MRFAFFVLVLLSINAFAWADNAAIEKEAQQTVEQMRGISMLIGRTINSNGSVNTAEQHKVDIIKHLYDLGKASLPALLKGLDDPDVQMRQNVELAMIHLGGGYIDVMRPKLDIHEATPALIKATNDKDKDVRGWAAGALAEIGPAAKAAIPNLIHLVKDPEEGPRNSGCIALGRIGPAAKDALPVLREALNDPSKDVRFFAAIAIKKIDVK